MLSTDEGFQLFKLKCRAVFLGNCISLILQTVSSDLHNKAFNCPPLLSRQAVHLIAFFRNTLAKFVALICLFYVTCF